MDHPDNRPEAADILRTPIDRIGLRPEAAVRPDVIRHAVLDEEINRLGEIRFTVAATLLAALGRARRPYVVTRTAFGDTKSRLDLDYTILAMRGNRSLTPHERVRAFPRRSP